MTEEVAPASLVRPEPESVGWRRWAIPLYPLVFPIALVVLAWSAANIHIAILTRPLVISIALGLVVIAVCTALAGNRDLGGILASVVLLTLIATDPRAVVLLAILAVLVALVILTRRGRVSRPLQIAAKVMRGVAIVLAIALTIKLISDGVPANAIGEVQADLAGHPKGAAVADAPDVVVLLLDAFPGERAMAMAGGDSAPFIAELEARGFDVQRDSHSNYLYTGLTIGSMLGMEHIHESAALDPPWDMAVDDARRLRGVINDGAALRDLSAAGYDLVSVGSGFDHAEVRRVDTFVTPWQPSEFEVAYLRLIAVGDLIDLVAPDLLSGLHRQRIVDTLDATRAQATAPHDRPRFVYGHVPAPHSPWVFDEHGGARQARLTTFYSDDPGDLQTDKATAFARSREQAVYVFGLAMDTVDRIIADAPRPTIVVVMSDHGTGVGLDPQDAKSTDLTERFSNLMAVRTPDGRDLVGDRLTPVNLFPRILTEYVGTPTPEHDDGTYAWDGAYLNTVPVQPVPEWVP